jgi:hypothetical chaperone protein
MSFCAARSEIQDTKVLNAMQRSIGLDFGTTNSVLAERHADGQVVATTFAHDNDAFSAFRSVLCFWREMHQGGLETRHEAGPWAIDRFVEDPQDCRFLQSFKTFAASAAFRNTTIGGQNYTFEDLLAGFFLRFREHAGKALDDLPKRIILGRPVTFAGGSPDDKLAAQRYEAAFSRAGFTEFHHVYEPVAAAFYFAQRLTRDATVLVADFGGGTSDFSIIHFAVTPHGVQAKPLGQSGVGIAGDTFDYRIIDHVISPILGKGTRYKSWGKILEFPNHYFTNFARWNHLSLMKSPKVLAELRALARDSLAPEHINAFIEFIDADVGYPLYRAVSETKMQLSNAERAPLRFSARGISIEETIDRASFDGWIAEDLERIDGAVDVALKKSGVDETRIDKVFLTGGTSFVPAVRRMFERRFGADKIETGEQLLSIAYGLALIGAEADITPWTVPAD